LVLILAMSVAATDRLEYCGQPKALRPRIDVACTADNRGPTLAPAQKVVFVRVEADGPSLEVGWAEK
jgi:hypothetical protein